MAHHLAAAGHHVEIFVHSTSRSASVYDANVRVNLVSPPILSALKRLFSRRSKKIRALVVRNTLLMEIYVLVCSIFVTLEFRKRNKLQNFDLVQSMNYWGLFVGRPDQCAHVVRFSSASGLYAAAKNRNGWIFRVTAKLELWAMKAADGSYAPSKLVAQHLETRYGINVPVIRPPAPVRSPARVDPTCAASFPPRYLLHFGVLSHRKGTDDVMRAAYVAWKHRPEMRLVVCGIVNAALEELFRAFRHNNGERCIWPGPLPPDLMTGVIAGSAAAILPSRVDNLPNAVIESLTAGVPVIGTRGSSIDELVEEGRSGALVDSDDINQLATLMVAAWDGQLPAQQHFCWDNETARQMHPEVAIANLLAFTKQRHHSNRSFKGAQRLV